MASKMTRSGCALVMLFLAAGKIAAAELTLLLVDPSGKPKDGCRIAYFRDWDKGPDERPRDFRSRFRGLVGRDIPLGEYEARILCGRDELYRRILVSRRDQFEQLGFSGRRLIFDGAEAPKLTILFADRPSGSEVWWIRLVGLYNGESHHDRFHPDTNQAVLYDPQPGIYQVTVQSSDGYVCTQEVEFNEFTQRWTFHASACSFEFDRFAHLVERDSEHKARVGPWHQEMQRNWEEFLRATEEAAERTREQMKR